MFEPEHVQHVFSYLTHIEANQDGIEQKANQDGIQEDTEYKKFSLTKNRERAEYFGKLCKRKLR